MKRERGRVITGHVAGFFAVGGRIFLLAVPLCVIHVALQGRFPLTNALIGDWWNLTHYLALFVIGYALLPDPRVTTALVWHRRVALAGAIVLTGGRLALIATLGSTRPYSPHYVVMLTLRGVTEWLMLVGVLGYARVYLDRPWGWLRWAGDRVAPFYIWHQTVIVVLGVWIVQWHTGVWVKFAAIAVVSLALTVVVCELVGRTRVTRIAFGMKPRTLRESDRKDASRPGMH
jgi:peptidoglycan/LPS O-acetylase OafA/YrhL